MAPRRYPREGPASPNLAAEAHAIVRVGKALLSAGAGSYRVRTAMEQVAASLGVDWVQSHVSLTEVTVTLFRGQKFRTQVGQIHSVGVNAAKLAALERLGEGLEAGSTPGQVESMVDQIDARSPLHPTWRNALFGAVACAAFAFLNNAGWIELAGVLLAAFGGQWVRAIMSRRHINQYVGALAAGLVAAFVYVGLMELGGLAFVDPPSHEPGYVASLLFLVPGFPLVTAMLDLAKTDMTAGVARLAYSLGILTSAAAALLTVSWAVSLSPDLLPAPVLPAALLWGLWALATFVGVAGFAVMFNSPGHHAVAAGCVGVIANLARLGLIGLDVPVWAAAVVGAFVIGLAAHLVARWRQMAWIIIAVPAALIMVPGAAAFRALIFFSRGQGDLAIANLSPAVFAMVGLTIGLTLARVLTDRQWTLDMRPPPPS